MTGAAESDLTPENCIKQVRARDTYGCTTSGHDSFERSVIDRWVGVIREHAMVFSWWGGRHVGSRKVKKKEGGGGASVHLGVFNHVPLTNNYNKDNGI